MTYRELILKLSDLTEEQLNCDLTVRLVESDEYFAATFKVMGDSEGVLDENHPVFEVDF